MRNSAEDNGGDQGYQPHLSEFGLSAGYARFGRGSARKYPCQGPLTAEDMGTSQQLNISLRKGEAADLPLGRDTLTSRGTARRLVSNAGGVPPVIPANASNARAPSRPPSSAFNHMLSPRQQYQANNMPSYRDAALLAAQHGLSAYAPSAVATANASRAQTQTQRSGVKGRPPPGPRPTQHSPPPPSPFQPTSPDQLPSCSAASPSSRRGGFSPSRGGLLPSRGSAPTPNSVHRFGDVGIPPMTAHRSSDVATVTVTYNDAAWHLPFDQQQQQPQQQQAPQQLLAPTQQPAQQPLGEAFPATHASGPTSSTVRAMSPGWGAAPPSVFEVDGRPGTRGGGPLYDMEGRPTTRGGQRPPSRAQLSLTTAQSRPPGHVAPLVLGPGWAGLFAGGAGTGSGEATVPSGTSTSPQEPLAGGISTSWSGEATDPPGQQRRQLLPLAPSVPGGVGGGASASSSGGGGVSSGSFGFSSPPGAGSSRGTGMLASMVPAQPSRGSGGHFASIYQSPTSPFSVGQQQTPYGKGGSTGALTSAGGASRPFSSKLSSIAETPASPAVPRKGLMSRLNSGSGNGRKAWLGRELSLAAGCRDRDSNAGASDGSPSDTSDEGMTDDSYRSNLDQNSSNRGSGRRPRSNSISAQSGSLYRWSSSNRSDRTGRASGSAGPNSPTLEAPATRPRR